MLENIIKTSLRFLEKNKIYTIINVLGLALGLAIGMLIFLYVADELSFDKFHKSYQNIYRVQERYTWNEYEQFWATCDGSMAANIAANKSEGTSVCRIMSYFNPPYLFANAHSTESGKAIFVDSSFLQVFSFPLKEKQEAKAFQKSNQIMISEMVATKLFGNKTALGKIIEADGERYEVYAVFRDVPHYSHMHFDVVFSIELLREELGDIDRVGPMVYYTYIRFEDQKARDDLQMILQRKMDNDVAAVMKERGKGQTDDYHLNAELVFIPLQDIHLKSHAEKEYETNGNFEYIIIYMTIALFILLLASINYVNLATASSLKRSREVGVRKVLGADSKKIFLHFISEAFILVIVSSVVALVFVELSFPYFNSIVGKDMSISVIWSSDMLLYLLAAIFILTFLSGLYPSLFMSNFRPLNVLSNSLSGRKNTSLNLILRRVLVVSQFSIAVFLTLASIIVSLQLNYIRSKDVGFVRDHVLIIPFNGESGLSRLAVLKEDFLKTPGVVSVTGSSNVPGERFGYYGIQIPDVNDYNNDDETQKNRREWFGVRMLCADKDFLNSFGFEIVEGRTFSADIASDSLAFILNEAAVKKYHIIDPIGRDVIFNYAVKEPKKGKIIGVVKDFHYASFHSEVDPLMIQIFPPFYRYVIIKIESNNIDALLAEIERKWHKHLPQTPYKYNLLDDAYEHIYSSDNRLGRIFHFFTFVALFLASLGLYGLVAFISDQRKAEIGIRKVLGASIGRLMLIMSKEFVVLILISNLIVWFPFWFFINKWLSDFAFHIQLPWWPFVVTTVFSVVLSLLIIGIKTWLTTNESPAEILRNNS